MLIGWTQRDLAAKSGVSLPTIRRIEAAGEGGRESTYQAIRAALEAAGVDFIAQNGRGPGVRLRRPA